MKPRIAGESCIFSCSFKSEQNFFSSSEGPRGGVERDGARREKIMKRMTIANTRRGKANDRGRWEESDCAPKTINDDKLHTKCKRLKK